jgi:Chain length determinant protein
MTQISQAPDISVDESEISLLDMLVLIAENLKLLIVGPIIAGLLALGIAFVLPQSFTSQVILALPASTPQVPIPTPTQTALMMVSPMVLDPVLQSLNLAEGRSIQQARTDLANRIKITAGTDGLLRMEVAASTPVQAQGIANAIIDTWLKSTIPGEQDRVYLEKQLVFAKTSLDSTTRLFDRLSAERLTNLNKSSARGEAGTALVGLSELQAHHFDEVLRIQRMLQGLSRDIVKQSPTLPIDPVAPNKSRIAVVVALIAGFALLLWVFVRQAWQDAEQSPEKKQKLIRLRALLSFSARKDLQ